MSGNGSTGEDAAARVTRGSSQVESRRQFVAMTIRGSIALGVGCLACSSSTAQPSGGGGNGGGRRPPRTPRPPQVYKAGPVESFDRDGHFDVLLKQGELYIFREGKKLTAMSAVCTHRQCIVRPQKPDAVGDLECPCHGSTFAADGALLGGQATSSLEHFGISVVDGQVVVDTAKTYPESKWKEPGAFVELP